MERRIFPGSVVEDDFEEGPEPNESVDDEVPETFIERSPLKGDFQTQKI